MAGGWSRDGAVQEQIDASVESAVAHARSQLAQGVGLTHCEDCNEPIPEARRRSIAGVRRCVACQIEADAERADPALYNRRGSKGSQMR